MAKNSKRGIVGDCFNPKSKKNAPKKAPKAKKKPERQTYGDDSDSYGVGRRGGFGGGCMGWGGITGRGRFGF